MSSSLITIEKILEQESVLYISDLLNVLENYRKPADFDDEYDYDENDDVRIRTHNLVKHFENDEIEIIGIDEDYHNLSVELARQKKYDDACRILDRGLSESEWPLSVDLLADYLNYSRFCKKQVFEKSDIYYERLLSIPQKSWSWRAFSFSLDYLMAKKTRTPQQDNTNIINKNIKKISQSFCKQMNTDQSYYDKYTVLEAFGDKTNAISALEEGTKLKVSPKCCLKMADIEFDNGNYVLANKYLEKCLKIYPVQPSINKGYASLLLALSKTSLLMEKRSDFNNIDDETRAEISDLYKIFDEAFSSKELTASWKSIADAVISVLETKTGVRKDVDDLYD